MPRSGLFTSTCPSKGKVNAKLVAPWYQHSIEQEENDGFIPEEKDIHQIQEELASLSIAAKGGGGREGKRREQSSNSLHAGLYAESIYSLAPNSWHRCIAGKGRRRDSENTREQHVRDGCLVYYSFS